jgi:hypothetical protein
LINYLQIKAIPATNPKKAGIHIHPLYNPPLLSALLSVPFASSNKIKSLRQSEFINKQDEKKLNALSTNYNHDQGERGVFEGFGENAGNVLFIIGGCWWLKLGVVEEVQAGNC